MLCLRSNSHHSLSMTVLRWSHHKKRMVFWALVGKRSCEPGYRSPSLWINRYLEDLCRMQWLPNFSCKFKTFTRRALVYRDPQKLSIDRWLHRRIWTQSVVNWTSVWLLSYSELVMDRMLQMFSFSSQWLVNVDVRRIRSPAVLNLTCYFTGGRPLLLTRKKTEQIVCYPCRMFWFRNLSHLTFC